MTTFNHLPFEIRAQIWKLTVEPRTVEVRIVHWNIERDWRLFSTTPVPAPLQTCREARNMALYKQAFSELGIEKRYVWLNFDIDLISIGKTGFWVFEKVAPLITRLKFQRENSNEYWYHWESRETQNFVNAKEVHVVCGDPPGCWWEATNEITWPCALENLFFIDPRDGLIVNGIEMEKIRDESYEAEERRIDEEYEEEARRYEDETRQLFADMTTL
ncbi:hypothetical protein V493_00960 [Pseudogymnoascus sp. VKM F-4281 (FW-2241)]|nr:hypothetical protein V493_00960 [Pseudogymnoascus sp. VKM F-4281 (FW-2241)]